MKPNFQAMSREKLRNYIKENRDDQEAFYAYMDKLATEPILAIHSPSDQESLSEIIMKVNQKDQQIQKDQTTQDS